MFKFRDESDCSLVIVCSLNQTNIVKKQLALYKKRWESIALKIGIVSSLDEVPKSVDVIIPTFMSYSINPINYNSVTTIDDVSVLTIYDLRRAIVDVKVRYTKSIDEAQTWLNELPAIFAWDTETCAIDENGSALDMYTNEFTMFSFASSETEAFVISREDQAMEDMVLKFLYETKSKVIVHNVLFDIKLLFHRTGKFITDFEDTQLLAKVYVNHTQTYLAKVSLKELAGKVYGAWAVSKDLFGIENKYNPELITYSGIDAAATMFVFNEFSTIEPEWESRPLDEILPIEMPANVEQSRRYFYENVIKPLVNPAIRMMLNGINLDMDKVASLDDKLIEILASVKTRLAENNIIKDVRKTMFAAAKAKQIMDFNNKKRQVPYYLKDYKQSDMVMRSYLVNTYLKGKNIDFSHCPDTLLPSGELKWSAKDVKLLNKYNKHLSLLADIVDKVVDKDDPIVHTAMIALASYKVSIYNKGYDVKISEIDESILPEFNPGSPLQLRRIFEHLQIEPLAFSKDTNNPSWGREQLVEVQNTTTREDIKELMQVLIEFSQSSIIKTTFVEGFKKYNHKNVLHGNFKLFGAKSFRPTSSKVNLLNLPSTGSIYAAPIKECFVAPEGFCVATIDFAALEDRIIANLSDDKNKLSVFTEGIDGHSLAAIFYKPDEARDIIGDFSTMVEGAQRLKRMSKTSKEAKAFRQWSKGISFKLAYGGYPDADKGGVITQEIFDAYHSEMYPNITKMRVSSMEVASNLKYIHLGLGCRLNVDDVDKDSRSLFNALSQFWSVLTLIAQAKLDVKLTEENMHDVIKNTASVYDSLYFIVKKDAKVIKWLNDTLVPIMEVDCFTNMKVHNTADLELGVDWKEFTELSHTITEEEIDKILKEM